ncbi:hypothetical protein Hanom_Chr03g00228241 [Helianthus anomalus]
MKTVRTDPGQTRGARYNQGGGDFLSFYSLFQCISRTPLSFVACMIFLACS